MNENTLSGLFFPAVAGLFFFMKKPIIAEETVTSYPVYSADASGLSGVARYLEAQKAMLVESNKLVESEQITVLSGVDKYLHKMSQTPLTGVARYEIRKKLLEKQAKSDEVKVSETGVSKYLKSQPSLPVATGVARYLKQQENLPQPSKVARYMARQALVDKLNKKLVVHVEATGVEKYLKLQESLPKASKVSKYLARQALLNKDEKQLVKTVTVTGVEKYLLQQESLPKVSRVAKYITRQSMMLKPIGLESVVIETSVDRYMRNRT